MRKTIFLLMTFCVISVFASCEKEDDFDELYLTEWVYEDDVVSVSFFFGTGFIAYYRHYDHRISKITYHYYLDSLNLIFTDNMTNDPISAYFIDNNRIHLYDPVIGDIIVLTKK